MSVARVFYLLAVVATVAGLSHFTSLLLVPLYAERDAYARVALLAPPFRTSALPAATPEGRAFPFADPAVAAAVCRYDLSAGPVRARAAVSRPGFSAMSLHSRRGVVFFALTDRAAVKGKMDALIVTAEQLRALVARDDEDNPSDDLRVVSPTTEGFVMTRVLSRSPDDLAGAAEAASGLTCALEPVSEAEK